MPRPVVRVGGSNSCSSKVSRRAPHCPGPTEGDRTQCRVKAPSPPHESATPRRRAANWQMRTNLVPAHTCPLGHATASVCAESTPYCHPSLGPTRGTVCQVSRLGAWHRALMLRHRYGTHAKASPRHPHVRSHPPIAIPRWDLHAAPCAKCRASAPGIGFSC